MRGATGGEGGGWREAETRCEGDGAPPRREGKKRVSGASPPEGSDPPAEEGEGCPPATDPRRVNADIKVINREESSSRCSLEKAVVVCGGSPWQRYPLPRLPPD